MKQVTGVLSLFVISIITLTCLYSNAYSQKKEVMEATVYVTAQSSEDNMFNHGPQVFVPLEQPDENYPTIFVDENKTFQTIEGFGGAFTDATAVVFSKLSSQLSKRN